MSGECKICGKETNIEVDVGYEIYLCPKHYEIATNIFGDIIDGLEETYANAKER